MPANHLMTPAIFQVLLSLSDESRHGYGIMREIDERTGGEVQLGPGTLYRSIGRMIEDGLIVEVEGGGSEPVERRRPYMLSGGGRRVLSEETARLRRLLDQATTKGVAGASAGSV